MELDGRDIVSYSQSLDLLLSRHFFSKEEVKVDKADRPEVHSRIAVLLASLDTQMKDIFNLMDAAMIMDIEGKCSNQSQRDLYFLEKKETIGKPLSIKVSLDDFDL